MQHECISKILTEYCYGKTKVTKKAEFQERNSALLLADSNISAFTLSVLQNYPHAVHVFDHFHVVKLMNDKLDEIRRLQYAMEKDVNKRRVLKGTHYLLLRNGKDIFDKQFKTRLDNALAMNKPLSHIYRKS